MAKNRHFIYKIVNLCNNKFYIGRHSGKLNDGYFGSGIALWRAINKYGISNFDYTVLEECYSYEEVIRREQKIVNEKFVKRRDTYNLALGGAGSWDRYNPISKRVENIQTFNVCVVDNKGVRHYVPKDDPRYVSGELKHFATGKHLFIDKENKHYLLYKDDPIIMRDNLTSVNTGTLRVRYKDGTVTRISRNHPDYLSGKAIHAIKNMVTVVDKHGNTQLVSIDNPEYVSGKLQHIMKDKIIIRGKDGNCIRVLKDDSRIKCTDYTGITKYHIRINKNGINKSVKKQDLAKYLSIGYELGLARVGKNMMIGKICPHCGLKGSGANMSRYHFNNCKQKET